MRMGSLAFFKEANLDQSYIEYKKFKWFDFHLKFYKFNVPFSLVHVREEIEEFWALKLKVSSKWLHTNFFNFLQLWFELKRWLIVMSKVRYENATRLTNSNYRIISLIDSIQITSEWILWQVLVLNVSVVSFEGLLEKYDSGPISRRMVQTFSIYFRGFCLIFRPVVVCGRGRVSSMVDFVMSIVMGFNWPLEPSLV